MLRKNRSHPHRKSKQTATKELEARINGLEDRLRMLYGIVAQKDKDIVQLHNRVYALESLVSRM